MFKKDAEYLFNLQVTVDGKSRVYRVKAKFTGQGEERDGEDYGYFTRLRSDGTSATYILSMKQAKAMLPVSWGADKEVWGEEG